MKTIITLALLTISSTAFADVTCTVRNHTDAKVCFQKAAYAAFGEGELAHSVGASRFKKSKEAFEIVTGTKPTMTYVGVAELHYDEDELMYFQVSRGEDVTPELVYSVSLPDLGYETDLGDDEELNEELYSLFLDIEEFHL